MIKIFFSVGIFLALITFYSSTYIVPEGRQVVITEFGKPVGDPVNLPGLYFKKPFIQDLQYVDARILSWDGFPNQIPTKDKKYIYVDTTARWKIINALKFIQSVQNERGAKARLDSILDANTRDIISNNNLVEAVRNSNAIYDSNRNKRQGAAHQDKKVKKTPDETLDDEVVDINAIIEEDISGDIEKIDLGRERLSQLIVKKSESELAEFGIELIDLQLRRISYEESVQKKVYERMTSERKRIAEKIRSIGFGEKAKIEGRLSRDLQEIESSAYKEVQKIKGEAEARSTAIFANALSKNPDFFEFIRSMESYEKSLNNTKFILSNQTEYLKYLKK
jgi:membrane protease subunit HflC